MTVSLFQCCQTWRQSKSESLNPIQRGDWLYAKYLVRQVHYRKDCPLHFTAFTCPPQPTQCTLVRKEPPRTKARTHAHTQTLSLARSTSPYLAAMHALSHECALYPALFSGASACIAFRLVQLISIWVKVANSHWTQTSIQRPFHVGSTSFQCVQDIFFLYFIFIVTKDAWSH